MSRNHFFTSDTHFGHGNIMKYCHRTDWLNPSERAALEYEDQSLKVSRNSIEAMNKGLIDSINNIVGPDDVLWFLGDWCFGHKNSYMGDAWEYRKRINCKRVHLFWGNHDNPGLEDIFTSHHMQAIVSIDPITGDYYIAQNGHKPGAGYKFHMNHAAPAIWDGSHKGNFGLYGHSHAAAEEALDKAMPGRRSLDVGVDNAKRLLGEYRPFWLHEVVNLLSPRTGWLMHAKSAR
jgi:calcineurin-like phosphoesterase family protein